MKTYVVLILILIFCSNLFSQNSTDTTLINQEINLNSEEVWRLEELDVLTYDQVIIILKAQKEREGIHDYQQLIRLGVDRSTVNELRKWTYISSDDYTGRLKFNIGEEFLYKFRYGNKGTKVLLTGNDLTIKRKFIKFDLGIINVYYGNMISPLRDVYYRGYWSNKELSVYPNMTVNSSSKEYLLLGRKVGGFSAVIGTIPREIEGLDNSFFLLRYNEENLFVEFRSRFDLNSEANLKACYYYGKLSLGLDWKRRRDGFISNSLYGLFALNKNIVWQLGIDRRGRFLRCNLRSYLRIGKYKINTGLVIADGFGLRNVALKSDVRWKEKNYRVSIRGDFRESYKNFQLNYKYFFNSTVNMKTLVGARGFRYSKVAVIGGMLGLKIVNFDFSSGLFLSKGTDEYYYRINVNGFTERLNFVNLRSNSTMVRFSGRYRKGNLELSFLHDVSYLEGDLNHRFNTGLQYSF